jgi:dolichol-phosphate mannosyltransferase
MASGEDKNMKLYSVVIPVYNEEESIINSYNRLKAVMNGLDSPYELIFVDDGSSDNSYILLNEIADADANAKVLVFSRNFGHQTAVTAGMNASRGDAVIIIDADMQDPPELIPEMIELWKKGNEVVYGKRNSRLGETFFKKFTAKVYYRMLKGLSDQKIPEDAGDFRLLDRKVVNLMNNMPEHNRYLRGMSAWIGFNQCPIEYTREERKEGVSKYSFKKMLSLAADGAVSMSGRPLRLVLTGGSAISFLGCLGLIALIIVWIVESFNPIILLCSLMALFSGLIMISAGILGAYIGRIYDEAKDRPLYIIKEMINFKE